MDKMQKLDVMAKPTVAYYSGWGGIEIKDIHYGINDYVVFIGGAWHGKPSVHRTKIDYAGNDYEVRPYFRYAGHRIYLDECIRT